MLHLMMICNSFVTLEDGGTLVKEHWWRNIGEGTLVEEHWWRNIGGGGETLVKVEEHWWRNIGEGGETLHMGCLPLGP